MKMDVLGSIFSGKMVFENGNCRTAQFNPIIAILMGREPIFNEKGASVDTETPLRYPEPGSNRHGLLHWCLRPARLPIPPSGLFASGRDWRMFRLVALQVAEGGRPSG